MPELLNHKELATVVAGASVTDGHSELLEALHTRYPETQFRLASEREGRSWDAGIIDAGGNRVTDSLGKWIDQELAAADGNARTVWDLHKNEGLIRTERKGSILYITAPYGSDPDAFYQLEVLVGSEMTTQLLFDPKTQFPPEDRFELLSGPSLIFGDDECKILEPAQYRFEAVVNVRQFLRKLVEVYKLNRLAEFPEIQKKVVRVQEICPGPEGWQTVSEVPFLELCPDWLDRLPPEYRLFQDWAESSPGRAGIRFCDHWIVQTSDYEYNGKRQIWLIPQWADADGGLDLPEIMPDREASPYGLMDALSEFDRQAGYPFAWYLYMIHGNRITCSAGSVVAKAILEGKMHPLPECDEKVLLRWYEQQYGF